MKTLFDIQPLLPALAAGELILTPNRRLAAKILAAWNHHQTGLNRQTWLSPRVQPLESWIQQNWLELQDGFPLHCDGILLDNRQQQLLWESVILEDQQSSPLLKPSGAATQAAAAWRTLKLWQRGIDDEVYQQHCSGQDLFAGWAAEFERRCAEQQWLTQPEVVQRLISAWQQGLLPGQPVVHLVAFQDQPPLYQRLLDAASERCDEISTPAMNQRSGSIRCPRAEDEIQLSAQWAAQVLARAAGASIGIVVPDLSNRRGEVERQFLDLFEPHHCLPDYPTREPPFNISIGVSLADTAVIRSALTLLRLKTAPLALDALGSVLYSPFLPGLNAELQIRVDLETRLRSLGNGEFWLSALIGQLRSVLPVSTLNADTESSGAPAAHQQQSLFDQAPSIAPAGSKLLDTLTTFDDRRFQGSALPGQWAQRLHRLLLDAGWPGDRTTSSLEYQQLEQWFELLSQLVRFDDLTGPIDFKAALSLITKETQAAAFQPKTIDSAIQILGPLEAAGLQFSHLWVMGMSDDSWPSPAAPNPLLPIAFQRHYNMPHATPERELEFCAGLTRTWINSAEIALFSHPGSRDDQQLRPSALIGTLPQLSIDQLPLTLTEKARFDPDEQHQPLLHRQLASFAAETIRTDSAPPVSAAELAGIRGGSSLLKNQALCPFSGFAVHRLGARPLQTPATGLSPADRGNLLHNALELLWREIGSLETLCSAAPDWLEQLQERICQQVLEAIRHRSPGWMKSRFWRIEHNRLRRLLQRWLEVERQRSNFVVVATEQSISSELAGLPLKLRIDRIDQLDDDSVILIDYKTGDSNPAHWAGDRPREPQLPLYALSSRKPVEAVAFAQLNAREVRFRGISDSRQPAPGIRPPAAQRLDLPGEWPQLLEHWRIALQGLAREFLAGTARVDPLDNNAYAWSGLEPLNRIAEFEQLADAEETTDEH